MSLPKAYSLSDTDALNGARKIIAELKKYSEKRPDDKIITNEILFRLKELNTYLYGRIFFKVNKSHQSFTYLIQTLEKGLPSIGEMNAALDNIERQLL